MPRLTIVFVSLLFVFSSNAQDYLEYHSRIYEAEQQINKKDYSQALKLYRQTFSSFPHVFHEDLNNAFHAAVLSNEDTAAFMLFSELISHGYVLEDFNRKDLKTLKIQSKCTSIYPKLRQCYLSKLNKKRRNYINKIFITDQHNARLGGKFGEPADTVWYNNAKLLYNDYIQNGFPTFLTTKDSLQGRYLIVLRHYFGMINTIMYDNALLVNPLYESMDFEGLGWRKKLEKGVRQGEISPASFKLIVEYRDQSRPFGGLAVKVDFNTETVMPLFVMSESKRLSVNNYRKTYGLPLLPSKTLDISNTWYSDYPFQKIRAALRNCDACKTGLDSMKVLWKIEKDTENKTKVKKTTAIGFKLRGVIDLDEVHYSEIK